MKFVKLLQKEKSMNLRTVKVDFFLESKEGEIFLFDLKTVKPNISNFKGLKDTFRVGRNCINQNPKAKVNTLISNSI